jgi:hypothetical protein
VFLILKFIIYELQNWLQSGVFRVLLAICEGGERARESADGSGSSPFFKISIHMIFVSVCFLFAAQKRMRGGMWRWA